MNIQTYRQNIFTTRLINLNADDWMPAFGFSMDHNNLINLCENVYEIYSSNVESVLNYNLNRLNFKQINITNEEQNDINNIFSNIKFTEKKSKSKKRKMMIK